MATVERLLVRGGHVLTMDPGIGDLARGDVLIEGSRVEAVALALPVEDARVIDASGMIVMPGMVDGHKHAWQTIFRGTCGDETLARFFGEAVPATAPLLRPEDVHASELLGAVDALDAGVTTFVDWCHATITPDHSRAAVAALRESGARAWFAHGLSLLSWSDRTLDHPGDLRVLQAEEFAPDDGLVRLAMAARGPMFADIRPTKREFELARSLGIPISVHVDMPGYPGNDVVRLHEIGTLGPDVTLLHGNTLTDDEIDLATAAGCSFVDSAQLDVLMGIGAPITDRLRRRGVRSGLSADTAVANPTDLFWVMRAQLLLDRARAYAPTFAADRQPDSAHLTAREMVERATIDGARAVWLGDRIGSLTPAKEADVVLLRAGEINVAPLNDASTAIVLAADRSNVDTVIVGGQVVKRDGRIMSVDPAAVVRRATEARDRIYDEAARRGYEPGWRSSRPLSAMA